MTPEVTTDVQEFLARLLADIKGSEKISAAAAEKSKPPVKKTEDTSMLDQHLVNCFGRRPKDARPGAVGEWWSEEDQKRVIQALNLEKGVKASPEFRALEGKYKAKAYGLLRAAMDEIVAESENARMYLAITRAVRVIEGCNERALPMSVYKTLEGLNADESVGGLSRTIVRLISNDERTALVKAAKAYHDAKKNSGERSKPPRHFYALAVPDGEFSPKEYASEDGKMYFVVGGEGRMTTKYHHLSQYLEAKLRDWRGRVQADIHSFIGACKYLGAKKGEGPTLAEIEQGATGATTAYVNMGRVRGVVVVGTLTEEQVQALGHKMPSPEHHAILVVAPRSSEIYNFFVEKCDGVFYPESPDFNTGDVVAIGPFFWVPNSASIHCFPYLKDGNGESRDKFKEAVLVAALNNERPRGNGSNSTGGEKRQEPERREFGRTPQEAAELYRQRQAVKEEKRLLRNKKGGRPGEKERGGGYNPTRFLQ